VTILISCTVIIIGIQISVGVGIIKKPENHIGIKIGTVITIHMAMVVLELVQQQVAFV